VHRHRIVELAWLAACAVSACSGQSRPQGATDTERGDIGVGEAGSAGAAARSSGGTAGFGNADPSAAAGAAGVGEESTCGNGQREPGEQCDGKDFAGLTCERAGFLSGKLGCSSDCRLDTSDCSGSEICDNLRDDDGDRQIDCEDHDCLAACANPCQAPTVLTDPALVEGDLDGRTATLDSECLPDADSKRAMMAYRIEASRAGVLDVSISAEADLVLSLRDTCDPKGHERLCSRGAPLVTSVKRGDAVTVVVLGTLADDVTTFMLQAASRSIVCGDGFADPGERCDDGNERSGDGCSEDCSVESSESGNNDDLAHADPYLAPFVGEIYPAADEDFVEFTVTEPKTALVAQVMALGEGACESGEIDSVLEILGQDGTILGIDDDSGPGACSKLLLPALPEGHYFASVSAAASAARETFPYLLHLDLDRCGNDHISDAEECDDGNTTDGDGCSASCEVEQDSVRAF
jgi:cysteine-rich repeat protein